MTQLSLTHREHRASDLDDSIQALLSDDHNRTRLRQHLLQHGYQARSRHRPCSPSTSVSAAKNEDALLYPWAAHHLDKLVTLQLRRELAAGRKDAAESPIREWRIDSQRSTLTFRLHHALVADIRGRFGRWGGTLTTDSAQPTRSSVSIWVDLASIDTGDQDRDVQVRSSTFFDVEHHPEARFASVRIRLPDHGNPIVDGRLDLHGIAHEVGFEIVDRRQMTDADGGQRAIYLVRGDVDRRHFGLGWLTDLDIRAGIVGAHVTIEGHVEAVPA